MFLLLLALGILAGLLAGLFGLGGGILFTPILFIIFSDAGLEHAVVLTIASSLFCTFVAALGSSIRQYRQHNFFWKEGLKVGLLGVVGVSLGKLVVTSSYYGKTEFVLFFSALLIYVAIRFFMRGNKNEAGVSPSTALVGWKEAGIAGGLGGFVAALAGIGGGGVMVPLLNLYYEKAFKKAVSISSLAIVFISLAGWLQLAFSGKEVQALSSYSLGFVDFGAALPLAVGGLAGGFLGALFNQKIRQSYLQYAFAVFAVVMAVKLLSEIL